jgi:heme-degrading monooxygenase HmoA
MIARLWHGRTRLDRADEYERFLHLRAMPDYRGIAGNLGAQVLRRDEGDVAHFLTLSYWQDEQAVRAFAGDDVLRARYYPEDADFLLEFEPRVQHYTVASAG